MVLGDRFKLPKASRSITAEAKVVFDCAHEVRKTRGKDARKARELYFACMDLLRVIGENDPAVAVLTGQLTPSGRKPTQPAVQFTSRAESSHERKSGIKELKQKA